MTLIKHELKQAVIPFLVWTGSIGFLLAVCIFLFPEMKGQMSGMDAVFSSMGSFTEAFGMDRLNFSTFIGFYTVECGNILGLGGAFYAALCASGILSKEEKDKTAEFLLTHPISRKKAVTDKLISLLILITAMNLVIFTISIVSILTIGEAVPFKDLALLHLAYFLMQLEIAAICFCFSSFMRRNSTGAALGIAALLYFTNLIANMSEKASFLKYITPFGYCDGADIIAHGSIDPGRLAAGALIGAAAILAAYGVYMKKDIQ